MGRASPAGRQRPRYETEGTALPVCAVGFEEQGTPFRKPARSLLSRPSLSRRLAGRPSPSRSAPVCRLPGDPPIYVVLRPLTPEDCSELERWDRDQDLVLLYGAPPSKIVGAGHRFLLAIEAGGRFAGLISLSGVSWAMRSAELRVVIGRRSDWGRGLGRGAVEAFLSHVFETTDLDFIYLRTLLGNGRAIKCYENCGFRRAGVLRVRHDPRYASPPLRDDILLMTYTRPSVEREDESGI